VTIKDFCASVNLTQKFKNAEDVPIEAVYQVPFPFFSSLPSAFAVQRLARARTLTSPFTLCFSQFPLDEKYCICDFTAEIDGKVIKGKCKEKEEAKVSLSPSSNYLQRLFLPQQPQI